MNIARLYLLLTIIGATLPLFFAILGLNALDWNLDLVRAELRAFFGSYPGIVTSAGLLCGGVSLAVFVAYEAQVRHDYYLLWVIPVILILGVSAALPLYLFLRLPKRDY